MEGVRLPTSHQLQNRLLDDLGDEGEQGLWEVAWSLDCSPGQSPAVIAAKVARAREAVRDSVITGQVMIVRADAWPPTSYRPVTKSDFLTVEDEASWVTPELADRLFFIRCADDHVSPSSTRSEH